MFACSNCTLVFVRWSQYYYGSYPYNPMYPNSAYAGSFTVGSNPPSNFPQFRNRDAAFAAAAAHGHHKHHKHGHHAHKQHGGEGEGSPAEDQPQVQAEEGVHEEMFGSQTIAQFPLQGSYQQLSIGEILEYVLQLTSAHRNYGPEVLSHYPQIPMSADVDGSQAVPIGSQAVPIPLSSLSDDGAMPMPIQQQQQPSDGITYVSVSCSSSSHVYSSYVRLFISSLSLLLFFFSGLDESHASGGRRRRSRLFASGTRRL